MSEAETLGLVNHLKELKRRLSYCLIVIGVLFCGLLYFANDLYLYLAAPLIQALGEHNQMIATDVTSPLLAPLKFVFILSIFISIPFHLYQLWAFIAPGLINQEKKFVWPLLISSFILFYIGTLFAYFVVFPLVFGFLVSMAPAGISVMPDISQFLRLVIKLFFAFGFAFEVPIAVYLMVKAKLVSIETLKAKRAYVFVGAFVVGMLLTPPDVVSQTLLAIPIWLLFEVGLLLAQKTIDSSSDDES